MIATNSVTKWRFSVSVPEPTYYALPATICGSDLGYSFAEFEAARSAVRSTFSVPNWDGFGALPIDQETRANALLALNHLEALAAAPDVTPNPNGTLSFEWETDQGFGVLEIGRTRYSYYFKGPVGQPLMGQGDAEIVGPGVGSLVRCLLYPEPSRPVALSPR